ncbi:hypothetical protein RCL1_002671 [Eukaryota sp. TZLM3-RCL]
MSYSETDYDEQRKAISGELYNPLVPLLCDHRLACKKLLHDLNSSILPTDRAPIYTKLFGRVGSSAYIEIPFRCDYGYNITIGDNFYCNFDCVFLDCGLINIGDGVMLGPGVHIYTVNHPLDVETRKSLLEYTKPVRIGDNCWIGGKSIILPGVTIGEGSVVAAGSIVTKDVPPFVLVAGSPAVIKKQLRYLYSFF